MERKVKEKERKQDKKNEVFLYGKKKYDST